MDSGKRPEEHELIPFRSALFRITELVINLVENLKAFTLDFIPSVHFHAIVFPEPFLTMRHFV